MNMKLPKILTQNCPNNMKLPEILTRRGRVPPVPPTSYATASMQFVVEGLIFFMHASRKRNMVIVVCLIYCTSPALHCTCVSSP